MHELRISLMILSILLIAMLIAPSAHAAGDSAPFLLAQVQQPVPPDAAQAPGEARQSEPVADQTTLPQTGTNVPLVALAGFLSMAGALVVRGIWTASSR
jgi:LPXTG-motif cell wall-anchored protein